MNDMEVKEIYKGWEIAYYGYGYYEAFNLYDCDAPLLYNSDIDELKLEIDEL